MRLERILLHSIEWEFASEHEQIRDSSKLELMVEQEGTYLYSLAKEYRVIRYQYILSSNNE